MADENPGLTESWQNVMQLDGDPDELGRFYDGWAATYEEEVTAHGYGLAEMMVATLRRATEFDDDTRPFADPSTPVLDAGCGTGLVGQALADAGYRVIDGVDLSPEMIRIADERGIYRRLEAPVDLTEPPPSHLVRAADVVTVGGVFTVGHVPPDALGTMVRLARPGGLIVVSTRRAYQEETNFVDHIDQLVERGLIEHIVHVPDAPYTHDSTGDYWAFRVTGTTTPDANT